MADTLIASPTHTVPASQSSASQVGGLLDSAFAKTTAPQMDAPAAPETVAPKEVPKVAPVVKEAPKTAKEVPKPVAKPETNGQPNPQAEEQRRNFAALKEKADWKDREWPKFEKKMNELEAANQLTIKEKEQWEGLKKQYEGELTEHRTWRAALDIENTPQWKKKIVAPLEGLVGKSDHLAKRFELDQDKLWDIINQEDEIDRELALKSLLEDHENGALISNLVRNYANRAEQIREQGLAIRKEGAGILNQIKAKKGEQTAKEQQEHSKAREETWKVIETQVPELFGVDDPEIKEELSQAQSAEFHDTPMERALAARYPNVIRAAVGLLRKREAEIEQLNATIAEISGTRPGGLGRPQELPPANGKPLTGAAALDIAFQQMNGRR